MHMLKTHIPIPVYFFLGTLPSLGGFQTHSAGLWQALATEADKNVRAGKSTTESVETSNPDYTYTIYI